jgi:TM2 domain-containing membrane protein YozV
MNKISNKSRFIDALLCAFLGYVGIHKFYEGKIGMGILYIFTCGLFGIGALVDLVMILVGSAIDSEGNYIKVWMPDDAERAYGQDAGEYSYDATKGTSKVDKEAENIQILKEYKDMLDNGIISQEEFDKKKKDILR